MMQNNRLILCSVIALSMAALMAAAPAFSQTTATELQGERRIPLVVVRFNQPDTHFATALTNAVKKAVETKPGVVFDVVVRPALASETAQANLTRVSTVIQRAGIPISNISTAATPNGGRRYDEVYVFVR